MPAVTAPPNAHPLEDHQGLTPFVPAVTAPPNAHTKKDDHQSESEASISSIASSPSSPSSSSSSSSSSAPPALPVLPHDELHVLTPPEDYEPDLQVQSAIDPKCCQDIWKIVTNRECRNNLCGVNVNVSPARMMRALNSKAEALRRLLTAELRAEHTEEKRLRDKLAMELTRWKSMSPLQQIVWKRQAEALAQMNKELRQFKTKRTPARVRLNLLYQCQSLLYDDDNTFSPAGCKKKGPAKRKEQPLSAEDKAKHDKSLAKREGMAPYAKLMWNRSNESVYGKKRNQGTKVQRWESFRDLQIGEEPSPKNVAQGENSPDLQIAESLPKHVASSPSSSELN